MPWHSSSRDSDGPEVAGALADSSRQSVGRPKPPASTLRRWLEPEGLSPRAERLIRISANLIGAGGAVLFAWATLQAYLQTHRLIGVVFFAEQMWVVVAYLVRRPALTVSRRLRDWLLAFGGTFAGVLLRPVGAHPQWGINAGLVFQLLGLAIGIMSFLALGRSFGFVAADRGLVRRGPYAVVRHPIYASYLFLQSGYLLQSLSVRNALVMLFASSCNVGRALVEERVLGASEQYDAYCRRVRWRLIPGIW